MTPKVGDVVRIDLPVSKYHGVEGVVYAIQKKVEQYAIVDMPKGTELRIEGIEMNAILLQLKKKKKKEKKPPPKGDPQWFPLEWLSIVERKESEAQQSELQNSHGNRLQGVGELRRMTAMEWHFGYNCKHFLPTLGKCRVLIEDRRELSHLFEDRWLSTEELLVYLNLPKPELLDKISSGEIQVKQSGKTEFRVSCAWNYDGCPLVGTGGQCLYFEAHDGRKISCIADLDEIQAEHPSFSLVPTEADIKAFESDLAELMNDPESTGLLFR